MTRIDSAEYMRDTRQRIVAPAEVALRAIYELHRPDLSDAQSTVTCPVSRFTGRCFFCGESEPLAEVEEAQVEYFGDSKTTTMVLTHMHPNIHLECAVCLDLDADCYDSYHADWPCATQGVVNEYWWQQS